MLTASIAFALTVLQAFAQEDLLLQLPVDSSGAKPETVIATFKGNQIINVQTNETVKKQNLDLRVHHLFGNIGERSGGGPHSLYGFDQSADIRIGLHYGISNRLMVGVSRSKRSENLEALMKFKLLEQTNDDRRPLAITLFGNTTYSARSGALIERDLHRLTYLGMVIFARKFSPKFSMVIVPSYLHRNFVPAGDNNNVFSVAGGFRWKFTRSASMIIDYAQAMGRDELIPEHYAVLGAGFEIETGGHVFTLMFTNASGVLDNDFLVNTTDNWGDGGIKFSFIISRMFGLGKE